MDKTSSDEKRDSVRALLGTEVQFSIIEAREYAAVKERSDMDRSAGHRPLRPYIHPAVADEEEGRETDSAMDPDLVDFMVQIDEKLDRILGLLSRHEQCEEAPIFVGEGLDISGSGMRILAEKKVEPGQILDSRFRIYRYPAVSLRVFGKVVRAGLTADSAGRRVYEIALEFLDLDEDYKEWIISYVFQKQRQAIRKGKKNADVQ